MPVEDHVAWTVGRYTVHGELASGGMATVHIGRMGAAGGFAKLVAIKRMHPQFAKDPDFLAMFLDEARLVTRIRHPNVVQPLDVIVEHGEVLLVMEYIHGDALSRINRVLRPRNERIPLRIAVAIMAGVLHGLHAAHEAKSERGEPLGIVHRDVSPQNVIVGVDGIARVLDFGIAKAADQVHLTREGELKGKLIYMAPEQLLGEQLTRRTDIFAASIVLWECFTGQKLFESDSQSALLARARMQKVDAPSELAPEISPTLDQIVLKGLAMRQEERWATARAMALALEEAVSPATPAQVGAWVEEVAAKALDERQRRIDEIESAGADSSGRSSRELVADIASDRVFTQDILSARSISGSRRLPDPPPPPAARSGPQRASQHTPTPPPRMTPTPPPASHLTPTPPPGMRGPDNSTRFDRPAGRVSSPSFGGSPIAPNAPSVHDPFYVPPAAPLAPPPPSPFGAPMLEPPPMPTELAKPAKTTVVKLRTGRVGTIAILTLLLAFLVFVLAAPAIVRSAIIDSLAKKGIVASIDEIDLYSQVGTARLSGVTLTAPDVPGATVHAREILVELGSGLETKSFVARDVDVNVDVGYAPLLKSLDAWWAKHPVGTNLELFPQSLQHARIESAHVVWNAPSGAGTRLEATSLTVDLSPKEGRPLGQDFVLSPTSVDVMTPIGRLGPWLFDASRTGPAYAAHLSFSQAHQQTFGLDLSGTDDTTKIDAVAARATPADIGLKPDVFGATPADVVKIDLTLHAERKGPTWTASTDFVVDGFHVPNAPPSTLGFALAFTGHAGAPLDARGRFSLGGAEAPMDGTLTVLDDGVAAKLTSSVLVKCNQGAAKSAVSFAIDSRDLGAASISPQTPFCAPIVPRK
ncbi:MAG TPA: serine/threonine-protein kinase [Polyangiaceae bacterium]|jgi:serine/threonine-protein kinase